MVTQTGKCCDVSKTFNFSMLCTLLFDSNVRIVGNLDHSIYWTFTISSFMELPADLATIWGLEIFGRRWSASGSLILASFFMVAAGLAIGKGIKLIK